LTPNAFGVTMPAKMNHEAAPINYPPWVGSEAQSGFLSYL
jgi:hypothetical protein